MSGSYITVLCPVHIGTNITTGTPCSVKYGKSFAWDFFYTNLMQIGLQIMQLFLVSTANCWLRVSDFYSVIVHTYIQNT